MPEYSTARHKEHQAIHIDLYTIGACTLIIVTIIVPLLYVSDIFCSAVQKHLRQSHQSLHQRSIHLSHILLLLSNYISLTYSACC